MHIYLYIYIYVYIYIYIYLSLSLSLFSVNLSLEGGLAKLVWEGPGFSACNHGPKNHGQAAAHHDSGVRWMPRRFGGSWFRV